MMLLLQTAKPSPRYTGILSAYTNASARLSDRELAVIPIKMRYLVRLLLVASDPANAADRSFCVQILRLATIRIDCDATLSKSDIVSFLKLRLPVYQKTGDMEAFIEKTKSTLKGLGTQPEFIRERFEANFLYAKAQLIQGKQKKLDETQLQEKRRCLSEAARLHKYLTASSAAVRVLKTTGDRVMIRVIAGQTNNTWKHLEEEGKTALNLEGIPCKAEIDGVKSELDSLLH